MKAKKIIFMENTFLLIPSNGFAPLLLLEQLKTFSKLEAEVFPKVIHDECILNGVEEGYLCIELLGPKLNVVNPSLYDFFLEFINNNLPELPTLAMDEDF